MDNRIAGLLIVIAALFFLWLYDTGRWHPISAILSGNAVGTNPPQGSGSVSLNQGGAGGTAINTAGGSLDPGNLNYQICLAWPEACPFVGFPDPTIQQPQSSGGGGGSDILSTVGSLLGGIGSIFGF